MATTSVESIAWALLQQHCGILVDNLALWYQGGNEKYYALCPSTLAIDISYDNYEPLDPDLGARLRLALDVVNACCACHGLEPSSNQRFWRRAMTDLWWSREAHPLDFMPKFGHFSHDFVPLTADSFAHYKIVVQSVTSMDEWPPELDAFWRSFFHCDNSRIVRRCQAKLRVVVRLLRPHLARHVRPLEIEGLMLGKHAMDHRMGHDYSDDLTSGFHSLMRYIAEPQQTLVRIRLAAYYGITSKASILPRDIADMALVSRMRPRVSVERLDIFLQHPPQTTQKTWSLIPTLGELLRVVLSAGTTKTVSLWTNPKQDPRFVGAVLSMVPFTSSLESLECCELFNRESTRQQQVAWLAFALFHSRRTPLKLLRLRSRRGEDLDDAGAAYLEAIMRDRMPLRDVVAYALEARYKTQASSVQATYFPLGSTALVTKGTQLYSEPGRGAPRYVVTLLGQDELLDVVAQVQSSVGVVYPGYGLLWVEQATMTWVEHPESAVDVSMGDTANELGELTAVTSLSLRFDNYFSRVRDPVSLRLFPSPSLESLDLICVSLTRAALEGLLQNSPRLKSLALFWCTLESIEPLIAPTNSVLSTLSLLGIDFSPKNRPNASFAVLLDALAEPTHPLFAALEEFRVDLSTMSATKEKADFRRLVRVLQQPPVRLQRVTFVVSFQLSRMRFERVEKLVAPLRGRLLSDVTPEIRSVTHRVLQLKGCNEDIVRAVLAFVGGPMEQTIGFSGAAFELPW